MAENKIVFTTEDGQEAYFNVLEEAKIGGVNYLLVTDGDYEEDAYIFVEIKDESGEIVYEMLEDEEQLAILLDYFNTIMDDVDLEM